MTLKSMGLWLALHEVDPSRVKQVNAVAREAAALCPDAILFPFATAVSTGFVHLGAAVQRL
jgi:hypothetical protein